MDFIININIFYDDSEKEFGAVCDKFPSLNLFAPTWFLAAINAVAGALVRQRRNNGQTP